MFLRLGGFSSPHPLVIREDLIRAVYFDTDECCVCVELLNGSVYKTSSSVESIFSLLTS